ncbi:MAG TPA: AAA family ATPase [Solirubrobacteraceae bacterium]|jgi:ATP/maltotriose-dependent transcriptional regulator MalT|nr:AAA family ATPase [Solirubrobacteraceae bacterium]
MRRRVSSPVFVGRGSEAGTLTAAVLAAGEGQPSLTVIAGDAGVGKTRLVREAEEQLRARGGLVLRGECLALSGEFPYAPIVGALRDAGQGALDAALDRLSPESRSEIGRLLPEISAELACETSHLNQAWLFERLLTLLRHLGDEAPVLFVIEDGHWADASTLDFLSFLTRSLSTERVAAIVTYRADATESRHPLRLLLGELIRSEKVVSLTLAPLGTSEIESLIEQIAGQSASNALTEEIFARSQGNPFFAEELLAASADGECGGLPASLRDALLVRCHGLSADALQLTRTLAVLGRPAQDAQLGAFAGIEEPRLSSALREALEAHVIAHRSHDDGFDFRHALLREALCSDLLPGERSSLHRSIAAQLAAAGASAPAELALHWDVAGEPAKALDPSIRAGLDAERVYASAEARLHFERAVRLWSSCDPVPEGLPLDRVELLRHSAQAARLTGDSDAAIAYCREAITLVDADAEPLRAALLYERAGEYLWDDEAALECYSTALGLLPAGCGCERARILGAKALALHFLQRWEQSRDCSREALDEARAAGARTEEGYAANVLGLALAFLGDHEEGERHVREAKRIAEECGTSEDTARTYTHLAEVLRIRGNPGGALEIMLQGEDLVARLGMENLFGCVMSVNAAEDLVRLGRWDEARARLALAEQRELSAAAELLLGALGGRLALGRGEFDEARAKLRRAVERCDEQTPVGYLVAPHAGLAELALWEGRPDDARRSIADAFTLIAGREEPLYVPVLLWLAVWAHVDLALAARPRSAQRTRHSEAAAGAHERLRRLTARYSSTDAPPEALAYLALCRAELARLEDGSPQLWAAAAQAWVELEHPAHEAYAGWREAEAVLGGGQPRGEVAARLRATREVAARLGAQPLVERIETLARAARIDVSPQPVVAAQERSPAEQLGLTPREVDVLELLAEGCTNREISQRLFISEKTTSIHVSRILSKLDAGNRVRAAATAHRLGLFDTRAAAD